MAAALLALVLVVFVVAHVVLCVSLFARARAQPHVGRRRWRAAVALGWQAGGRAVDVLALLLDHADPEVRSDAALALGLTRAHAAEKPLRWSLPHSVSHWTTRPDRHGVSGTSCYRRKREPDRKNGGSTSAGGAE